MGKKTKRRQTFIREWRKFRGLTQDQLAERIGVTQETVSKIERGKIEYTQHILEAIAEALRCEPADLIMRDPTKPGSIWSIWDQVAEPDREQAARVLGTFVKRTGTEG